MKKLTRILLCSKRLLNYSKTDRLLYVYRKGLLPGSSVQCLRLNHGATKAFEGPGLRDFIAQDQNIKLKTGEDINPENVPYINELDINGNGQKGSFFIPLFGYF